jgi:hypothetical protein
MGAYFDAPHWPTFILCVVTIAVGIGLAKFLGWL